MKLLDLNSGNVGLLLEGAIIILPVLIFIISFIFVFIKNLIQEFSKKSKKTHHLNATNETEEQDEESMQTSEESEQTTIETEKMDQPFSEMEILKADSIKTKLCDIAGLYEIKEEIKEIIKFLKSPEKFQKMGAKLPKGILFLGPPGTGKTLLARAIAGEISSINFISIIASDFFVETWMGSAARRIGELFRVAREKSPCIIFIDEIDAISGVRNQFDSTSASLEYRSALNKFLAEMDGFFNEQEDGVIIIGATNDETRLDPALLRAGRFDRKIHFQLPDTLEREEILNLHFKKRPINNSVDLKRLAEATKGMNSADLANLANEAAIAAVCGNKKNIDQTIINEVINKIFYGTKQKSYVMSVDERKAIAYHEAGHILVEFVLFKDFNCHNETISIIPRTNRTCHADIKFIEQTGKVFSKKSIEHMIAVLLGGRAAENIIFGSEGITTISRNDLKKAIKLAESMVTEWGFSNRGMVYFTDISIAENVDQEIQAILQNTNDLANQILKKNIDKLHFIAQKLEKEGELCNVELKKILLNKKRFVEAEN